MLLPRLVQCSGCSGGGERVWSVNANQSEKGNYDGYKNCRGAIEVSLQSAVNFLVVVAVYFGSTYKQRRRRIASECVLVVVFITANYMVF